ncbi:hypothetical protein [Actinokineospora sp.]|uniref:hypothetical protein n=1 Tax=Actinokineospora sp. TaxID=1872133 RepID=UPI003D6C55CB
MRHNVDRVGTTTPLINLDPDDSPEDAASVIALLGRHRTELTVVQTAVAAGTLTARIVADYLTATERAAAAVQRHVVAPPPVIDIGLKMAARQAWTAAVPPT